MLVFFCYVAIEVKGAEVIRVKEKQQRVLWYPKLSKVALADPSIARIKALSSNEVLLTGIKVGQTHAILWGDAGRKTEYEIEVISPDLFPERKFEQLEVRLELLEMTELGMQEWGVGWPQELRFSASANAFWSSELLGINATGVFHTAGGFIRYLEKEGWAQLIARPHMLVRLGEQVQFHAGGEFPILSTSDSSGHLFQKVEWKTYGLDIEILPQSMDGRHIFSDVNLSLSDLDEAVQVGGVPALRRKKIKTKVNAVEGEVVLLSGLFRESKVKQEEGVILLKDIPVLGSLFSWRSRQRKKKQLMMSIQFDLYNSSRVNERRSDFASEFNE